jgi:hypothetical protein
MKRAALMIAAILWLSGCGPGNVQPAFEKVEVERLLPSGAKAKTTVTDQATVAKLASFFPGVGQSKQSDIAAGWKAAYRLTFVPATGAPVTARVDSAGEAWTEGRGDWKAQPGLKELLGSLLDKGGNQGSAP